MKTSAVILFIFLVGSSARALDANFTAYMRGGTGSNLKGGKQECFYQNGIPNNFMRLGNECGFYTELGMLFDHVKPTAEDPTFFQTQLRLEYSALGAQQWETAANRDMNEIEAFVRAGGFAEVPGTFWVGKRFYRDVDVYIFDWYYYADMSGVGAGIEDIPLGSGTFAIANLMQANETVEGSVGRPDLQAIDLRWKNVVLNKSNKLNLWGVYAWAPGSTGSDGTLYVPTTGYSLATRLNSQVFDGNNNASLFYGQGAMKDLNIYGNSAVPSTDDQQNHAWTWRFVEEWSRDVTDKWALLFAAAAQRSSDGSTQAPLTEWHELGVRPIYFVSDRFQWAFEAGYSHVKVDNERNTDGSLTGGRDLTRLTVAPQLSIGKSMWGRPVMRAYLTHSFWNSANKQDIAVAAPSSANEIAGTSFGYQFEVWF